MNITFGNNRDTRGVNRICREYCSKSRTSRLKDETGSKLCEPCTYYAGPTETKVILFMISLILFIVGGILLKQTFNDKNKYNTITQGEITNYQTKTRLVNNQYKHYAIIDYIYQVQGEDYEGRYQTGDFNTSRSLNYRWNKQNFLVHFDKDYPLDSILEIKSYVWSGVILFFAFFIFIIFLIKLY